MTENLVDVERRRRVALVSGSCCAGRAETDWTMRPSASTAREPPAAWAFCFFLFLRDLLLPRERKRLRKPMIVVRELGLAGEGRGELVEMEGS